MKIAVVGAGAIGAYVGASLARGGADVHLVARRDNLKAMRENGVRVLSERGDFHVHPSATDDPSEIGPVDVIFLGLKSNSYAGARPLLEPLMGPDTAVVAAQNGIPWWYFHGHGGPHDGRRIETVDPDGSVSEAIAPERAIGCVAYPATVLEEPGVVRHLEGTRFSIGEPDRSRSERCERFSEAMVAGGLKCPIEEDLRNDIWVKLMGNVSFNPLSALTRATMVSICTHEETRRLVVAMMEELVAVAAALGYELEISIEKRLAGAEAVGEHKTSTLQDLEAGKDLELAAIVGAVVELADLTETDVPSIRAVNAATMLLAETVGQAESAGQQRVGREATQHA